MVMPKFKIRWSESVIFEATIEAKNKEKAEEDFHISRPCDSEEVDHTCYDGGHMYLLLDVKKIN